MLIKCCVVLCYVMLCYVMLCYVMFMESRKRQDQRPWPSSPPPPPEPLLGKGKCTILRRQLIPISSVHNLVKQIDTRVSIFV